VACDSLNLGPGLCITSLQEARPRKLLAEADLEITSVGSWSPDGQRIAFSAFEPGGRLDSMTVNSIPLTPMALI
jgi:hypothetical protein